MPQPLQPPYDVTFGSYDALRARPELAAEIGIIIAMWAEIECGLGLLLARLMGADAETGITIYNVIRSDAGKLEVLGQIAKERFGGAYSEEVKLLSEKLRARSLERNRIAHGLWGISQAHPDALVHLEPKDKLRWRSAIYASPTRLGGEEAPRVLSLQPQLMIYNKRDFLEIQNRIEATAELLSTLRCKIPDHRPPDVLSLLSK